MIRRGLVAGALGVALLLPGCVAIPPAAIGAIAGAAAAAFRLDDDIVKLVFGPGASSRAKGSAMIARSITSLRMTIGALALVPLVLQDQVDLPFAAPAGASATSDNPAIASASLSADGKSLSITAVSIGAVNVTYTDGTVTATLPVTVETPVLTNVLFGEPVFAGG